MGKIAFEAYGSVRTLSGLAIPPENCVIVGRDRPAKSGEEHLLNGRENYKFQEHQVLLMMKYGVVQGIVLVKGPGGDPLVWSGRQRCINLREANRRLRALNKPALLVMFVQRAYGKIESAILQVAVDHHRTDDDVVTEATQMRSMLQQGVSPGDAALAFTTSRRKMDAATVKAMVKMLECATPELQAALADGRTSFSAVEKVMTLTPAAQNEALAKGKLTVFEAAEEVRRVKRANGGAAAETTYPRPTRTVLRKLLAKHGKEMDTNFRTALKWVLGEAKPPAGFAKLIDHLNDKDEAAE